MDHEQSTGRRGITWPGTLHPICYVNMREKRDYIIYNAELYRAIQHSVSTRLHDLASLVAWNIYSKQEPHENCISLWLQINTWLQDFKSREQFGDELDLSGTIVQAGSGTGFGVMACDAAKNSLKIQLLDFFGNTSEPYPFTVPGGLRSQT